MYTIESKPFPNVLVNYLHTYIQIRSINFYTGIGINVFSSKMIIDMTIGAQVLIKTFMCITIFKLSNHL